MIDMTKTCIGNDPACPCQDGDPCHYIDSPGAAAFAVAWVPVHPKYGFLWANTTASPSPERLPDYPLAALYFRSDTRVAELEACLLDAGLNLAAAKYAIKGREHTGFIDAAQKRIHATLEKP